MGSNTRRKARRWLGGTVSHAVVLKGSVPSGRTICGLDVASIKTNEPVAGRCHSCEHSISHNVLVEWVKP